MNNTKETCSPYLSEPGGGKVYRHVICKKLSISQGDVVDYEAYIYEVYLEQEITGAINYAGLCNLLRLAERLDTFNFYLANYGGSCHSLINLISAVFDSKANTVMHVTAPCYSAAATLALCGTGISFCKHSFLMFHNYSSIAHGKGNELLDHVKNTDKWIKDYMRKLHQPFLTKEECLKIEDDKDIYVSWDDKTLKQRIERHWK